MWKKAKKSISTAGLSLDTLAAQSRKPQDQIDALEKGMSGGHQVEAIPHFNKAECEKVIEGENNSFIVLGRDRHSGKTSGYGGKGDTQCAMVDIVAGRMSPAPIQETNTRERVYADPLFVTKDISKDFQTDKLSASPSVAMDAARIYMSQKTDIDHNFKLAAG